MCIRDRESTPVEIARACLILYNVVDEPEQLSDDEFLNDIWANMTMRLQAVTDQHEAMSDELQNLAKSDPKKFSPEQIWVLIRSIKVQSQVLQLYHSQKSYELS